MYVLEVRSLFDYCTKERRKLYKGPTGDTTKDYTLYELERVIRKEAAMLGVDTFLYAPDAEGEMWDMATNHSRIKFAQVKLYIDKCLEVEPVPVFLPNDPEIETEESYHNRAKV